MSRDENVDSRSQYERDRNLARRMASEDHAVREQAWSEFHTLYRKQIRYMIETFSSGGLSDYEMDRIQDRVLDRLLKDNFAMLRQYEGRNCTLRNFLRRPVEWECIAEWRSKQRLPVENLDELIRAGREPSEDWDPVEELSWKSGKIPEVVLRLDDERRWVFLLRYYGNWDWGFPVSQVRALATARGVPIGEIGRRLTKIFDEDAVLAKKQQRKDGKPITTPYEAIGYILMVDNLNTLRSRMLEARKMLMGYFESIGTSFS